MADTRPKCVECNGRGLDEWNGTCLRCGGQGREPFREWGKEDDEDQPACRDLMKMHDETMQKLKEWVEGSPVSRPQGNTP